ncbi:MAG: TVP38/TMEM64 family protein [Clostridia bacterium]|nr:TVP38/TMEM64 family protein [Clostridia bacterium]MBR5423439.1 TVP38/TMEM64 family protein [Clostridia bacterium]
MKKKDVFLILLRAAVAMALFAVAIVNYDKLSNLDIREVVSFTDSVPLMCAVILAVYVVKALVFVLPASVIYVAVGTILPPWLAVCVNLAGIFLEVTVTYLLGRFLGKDAVYRLLSKNEKGKALLEKNPGGKAGVIAGIRAVPAFPIDAISLFYGASGVAYPKYAALSVLGISWRVILFTLLGDAVFAWIPMDKIILAVIVCIPIGVGVYLIKKFVFDRKKIQEEEKQ